MPTSRKPQDMGEVHFVLDAINEKLAARDKLDEERRKLDDTRAAQSTAATQDLLMRTTALESNWTSFFSEKGAFPMLMSTIKAHGKKIDRQNWIVATGVGIMLAIEAYLKVHR